MHSLNGILISTITIFICLYLFCKRVLSIFVKNKLYLFITLFVLTIFSMAFINEVNSNKKFANIVNDAAIGWQIDKYSQWKMDSGCIWECSPKMADGYSPNHSTYFRVASFHKGLLLLIQHPLGSGITHLSYGYYMLKEYPNSIADHTHSGWIDFALGVGLPGLFLVWLAILTTILRNIKIYKNQFDSEPIFNMPIITITSLTGITILWVILEAGEKEYIKHLFFMISFFAAATPVEGQKLGKLSSK
jgi:O-antigen ligase